ncbi:MAG: PDZ domain-containing protein [Deltaproteobacteria bacterium]|nr:PDZ domain-containing protein [Deltaproteobacteria bacterium]
MSLLLDGSEPPKSSESWMDRYLKPLVVAVSLVAALFLTISRRSPEGGITVSAQPQSRAAPDRVARHYDLTALKVFTVVLGRIKDHYVEPERVKPREMLREALDAIEKEVAEVLIKEAPDKKTLTIRVQDTERTFDVSGVDSPWALSSRMKSILRFMQPHLLPATDIRDVEYAAINGMLSTLDPHSVLLKPDLYNEMKLSTRGEFGGLGIVIAMIQGVLTVMNPMKGTPAETAGIKSCDQILKINDDSTMNMTLNQAVSKLRGVPGSRVDVTIQRAGWAKPVRKTLTRAIIKVDSVNSRIISKKIGYVRLGSFQGNSYDDLRDHVRKLKKKGMKGLILDLRGNPGGLLDQAIKISDMFIESGTLLTTVSHAGKLREEKRAKLDGTEERYPIAVLVSSGSASASEIVAGALKHLDRAVIIGRTTFGKGSVQVLYDNDDGSALKLTIAQYLTPGDISIQSVGITPDIGTAPAVVKDDFLRLRINEQFTREQDLSKHLTHRNVRRNEKPLRTVRYLATDAQPHKDEEEEEEDQEKEGANLCLFPDRRCKPTDEDKFVEDFQIRLARDLLAQARGWRRSQVLAGSTAFFAKREQEEDKRVADALEKLGVDWSDGKSDAKAGGSPKPGDERPKLSVSVTTEPKGGKAKACQAMKLKVTVKNEGKVAAHRLQAVSESTNRLFAGRELAFGRVEPGASRTWVLPMKIRDLPTRVDDVTLKFTDGSGTAYPPNTFHLSTKGVDRPTFAYGYQMVDDIQGNEDGRIQRGEQLRLLVKVRNTGKGPAFRTMTTLRYLGASAATVGKGRFDLGRLEPGESKTASFTLDVDPGYQGSSLGLELKVYDDALGETVSDKLSFQVVQPQAGPAKASGGVRVNGKRVAIHAWAAADAPVVGHALRGGSFKVLGRHEGWYRILAAPERPAFVSSKEVTPGSEGGTARFQASWQVTPPKLTLQVPTYLTSAATIRVSGSAVDETKVADLFIFVRNPDAKVERKVYYQSTRNSKTPNRLDFATDLPLWPGANYVSVYTRESADVQANETVVIFRKRDKGAKEGAAAAR